MPAVLPEAVVPPEQRQPREVPRERLDESSDHAELKDRELDPVGLGCGPGVQEAGRLTGATGPRSFKRPAKWADRTGTEQE